MFVMSKLTPKERDPGDNGPLATYRLISQRPGLGANAKYLAVNKNSSGNLFLTNEERRLNRFKIFCVLSRSG